MHLVVYSVSPCLVQFPNGTVQCEPTICALSAVITYSGLLTSSALTSSQI